MGCIQTLGQMWPAGYSLLNSGLTGHYQCVHRTNIKFNIKAAKGDVVAIL